MGVIEGGEVASSGDEGGGTCHNDKPGQSKEKELKMGIQKGGGAGELEGGSGGTFHNDKPGRNDGYDESRYDYGGSEGGSRRIFLVAVKLLLEVKKRSKISSPTETNKNQPNQHQPTKARVS